MRGIERDQPGARDAVAAWSAAGVRTVLVSGGIREAIVPLAEVIGLKSDDLHAVSIRFDDSGGYDGFDAASPLSVATGKRDIVDSLSLPRPILVVGDGSTDAEMRDAADAFAAFTGFAARATVVSRADFVVSSFDDLRQIVGV